MSIPDRLLDAAFLYSQDLYPHVAEMPDDVIGWNLFGTRRDGATDYVEARRHRVDRRLLNG